MKTPGRSLTLLLIEDSQTGTILFMGLIFDPQA